MSHCPRPSRQGAALLIVLATLVLVTCAVTIVARAAVTHQLSERMRHSKVLADDLLAAAEAPILEWLRTKSSGVVLSNEAPVPGIEIMRDAWSSGGGGGDANIELVITAWDQCGMVPLHSVEGGSPLRMAIPESLLRTLPADLTIGDNTNTPGLDWLVSDDPRKTGPGPYPRDATSHTIGAFIATHNRSEAGGGVINVNTAPILLVEAALRTAGRGGLEQIIASRREGKPTTVGAATSDHSGGGDAAGGTSMPQLVTSSNCWAFRIDINIAPGPRKCSWWVVYQLTSGQWEMVQRLAITD